jgi:hypothetical protein
MEAIILPPKNKTHRLVYEVIEEEKGVTINSLDF